MSDFGFRTTAPGKVFLMGEYAVLAGGAAVVLPTHHVFELATKPAAKRQTALFHSKSPAGLLLSAHADRVDPARAMEWRSTPGSEGFGSSTAEFLCVDRYLFPGALLSERWNRYRSLAQGVIKPSGADLIAQAAYACIKMRIAEPEPEWSYIESTALLSWSASHAVRLFRGPEKTKTHEHLASGALDMKAIKKSLKGLESLTESALVALARQDLSALGRALGSYAEQLAKLGLEAPRVRDVRKLLSASPGVWGVKGCGAMGTDALWVIMDPSRPSHDVERELQEHGYQELEEWFPYRNKWGRT
jgi:mevalonate kinase